MERPAARTGVLAALAVCASACSPDASGSFDGDTLTVRYNLVMMLTDFEDAVYRLQPD